MEKQTRREIATPDYVSVFSGLCQPLFVLSINVVHSVRRVAVYFQS